MQDLTLVGVADDGEHLVLAAPDGTRFRLLADDGLRLAARRTARAPGEPATSPLTPREIQARLRAGEDAAEIAAATGAAEERVRRYEAPVLAERAHVATRARALPVRWRDGSGRSPALEDLVAERLAGRGAEGTPAWDAWRREDGAWLVQAVFRAGARERRATWAMDLQRASLEALDDESRWLSSVDAGSGPPVPDAGPRLAPVREEVYDVDETGGARRARSDDDAPVGLASRRTGAEGRRAAGTGDGDGGTGAEGGAEADRRERVGRTLDLLEHLRGRRGRRQPLADPEDEEVEALTWAELEALTARVDATPAGQDEPQEHADEDAGAPGREDPWDAAGEPPAAHPPASRPEEALDDEVLAGGAPAAAGADETDGPPHARRRRRGAGPGSGSGSGSGSGEDGVPGQEELLPVPDRGPDPRADPRADRAGTEPDAPAAHPPEGEEVGAEDERVGAGRSDEDGPGEPRRSPARKAATPRRGARPGVPSWDDIVFGQRRD